ncbi:hypothetical protein KCW65_23885, partial [Mycobacterium tuberculosis]|nr:hypothetical protein [Mycobacterium tuberculosis]
MTDDRGCEEGGFARQEAVEESVGYDERHGLSRAAVGPVAEAQSRGKDGPSPAGLVIVLGSGRTDRLGGRPERGRIDVGGCDVDVD